MGMFSNYALQAGVEGADLASQLRMKALAEQEARMKLQEQQRMRQDQAVFGQAMERVLGQRIRPLGIPRSPAPGQASVPMRRPAPPMMQPAQPNAGISRMEPNPAASALPLGAGGGPGPAAPPARAGQETAGTGAPVEDDEPDLSWATIFEKIREVKPDADGETVGRVALSFQPFMQDHLKRMEMKDARSARAYQIQQELEFKREKLLMDAKNDRLSIEQRAEAQRNANDIKLLIAQLAASSRENVAGINADAKIQAANIAGKTRLALADVNNASRERIEGNKVNLRKELAVEANALKKDLKEQELDLKADEIAKTFFVKNRALELQEKGLNQKDAHFLARLEADKAVASMRDETTRRGQDMLAQSKTNAAQGKLDVERSKVEAAMPNVLANFDAIRDLATKMIDHAGLENATGSIESRLITLRGDTANFEALLKRMQAMVGFQALADMRAASPTGGALGNVSNREVEFLQNTMAALSLSQDAEQFREQLLDIMNHADQAKARTLKAYETRFTQKPTGGAAPAGTGEGPPIPTPKAALGEPDGTVFEMGGTQYRKQGAQSVPVK